MFFGVINWSSAVVSCVAAFCLRIEPVMALANHMKALVGMSLLARVTSNQGCRG